MTIDVNLYNADEEFLDNLDDIMEESMVQMFILHPTSSEISRVKELAEEHTSIFYSLPLHLRGEADSSCVAFSINDETDRGLLPVSDKPIVIDDSLLDEDIVPLLNGCRGIILNAAREYPALPDFLLAMGIQNVQKFDTEVLGAMSMDRIVLQSSYPHHGFEEIMECVKVISNAMFRPEQSIIARATKSSLELFGFRKS